MASRKQQDFFKALDWYWENEGKTADKSTALIYFCEAPVEFIAAIHYLKMDYGTIGHMTLEDLDQQLIDVLPGFIKCRLYLEGELGTMILSSAERRLNKKPTEEDRAHIKECLESMQKHVQGEDLTQVQQLLQHQALICN